MMHGVMLHGLSFDVFCCVGVCIVLCACVLCEILRGVVGLVCSCVSD